MPLTQDSPLPGRETEAEGSRGSSAGKCIEVLPHTCLAPKLSFLIKQHHPTLKDKERHQLEGSSGVSVGSV